MKTLALCVAALGIASSAFAGACISGASMSAFNPTLIGGNTSCTFSGNGQTYTLGDFTFLAAPVAVAGLVNGGVLPSDFNVSESVGANGPQVTVTPNDPASTVALAGEEIILFGFDITSNNPTIGFNDVNLDAQSTLTGIVSTATVAEEDCYGGLLPSLGTLTSGNILSLNNGGLACLGGGPSLGTSTGAKVPLINNTDVTTSIPIPLVGANTASVDVLKEINLTVVLGSAEVTSIGQTFGTGTITPEPASIFFTGCGLLSLGIFTRRRAKR